MKDGKVVCFFQSAAKARYATFGFSGKANLDDGNMWPSSFALKELTSAVEKKIAGLVKKAAGYLGLSIEECNMGWVARYTSPETGANVQLVTSDVAAPENPVISVLTEDVDGAYAEARDIGDEILRPLTTEPWGVRRFFVRAPNGTVINIVRHHG
jgi:predicted enzyme related to lactoylglutathione lyase